MESARRIQNMNQNVLENALARLKEKSPSDDLKEVHQKALDDIVNVNSLFTIAVFVGLSFAAPHQKSLENRSECDPDTRMAKKLVTLEVASFACFLLSSIGAKSLKVLINLKKIKKQIKRIPKFERLFKDMLLTGTWRRFLLVLSIVASFVGIVLLTLSMVYVIQIRIGRLSCGSDYALKSVASMCGIVLVSLLLYAPSMAFAVMATAPKN